MTTAPNHRAQFLSDLARLQKQFAAAARAFERDDHDASEDEITALTKDLDALVERHIKAYPAVLKENRIGPLPKDAPSAENSTRAAQLLKTLIHFEKALHVMEKEICRSYPKESALQRLWRKRKMPILLGGSAVALGLALAFIFWPRHGLQADYYEGTEFQKLIRRRIDRSVDFDWGYSGPMGMADHFSIRWTGTLCAPHDGTYEFVTRSDDGVRLWINNKLLIDDWNLHALKTDRGSVTLQKGANALRLEYFEYARGAQIQLRWRPDSDGDDQPLPANVLFPDSRGCPSS